MIIECPQCKAKYDIPEDRVKGKSKMSANIFREAFLGVIKMRFTIKQAHRPASEG